MQRWKATRLQKNSPLRPSAAAPLQKPLLKVPVEAALGMRALLRRLVSRRLARHFQEEVQRDCTQAGALPPWAAPRFKPRMLLRRGLLGAPKPKERPSPSPPVIQAKASVPGTSRRPLSRAHLAMRSPASAPKPDAMPRLTRWRLRCQGGSFRRQGGIFRWWSRLLLDRSQSCQKPPPRPGLTAGATRLRLLLCTGWQHGALSRRAPRLPSPGKTQSGHWQQTSKVCCIGSSRHKISQSLSFLLSPQEQLRATYLFFFLTVVNQQRRQWAQAE